MNSVAKLEMELEFDKEIDALLREDGRGRTITISEFAAPHLDADELSAFAENALPDAARKGYIAHMADCDRCRKTLSGFIASSEARPTAADAALAADSNLSPVAATAVPWYRRLFAIQNLAYGMGALVLLFTGFIGYTIFQYSGMGEMAITSEQPANVMHATQAPAAQADNFETNVSANANTSNTTVGTGTDLTIGVSEDAIGRSAANTAPVPMATPDAASRLDGADLAREESPVPPPPAAAAAAPAKEARTEDDRAMEKAKVANDKAEDKEIAAQKQMPSAENMANTAGAGPGRTARDADERLRTAKRSTAPAMATSPEGAVKTISGKNFTKREGVWYDAAYTGKRTTNVRRGTDAYRKLDRGLRVIAESLEGTVVVVWQSKAYRIQ